MFSWRNKKTVGSYLLENRTLSVGIKVPDLTAEMSRLSWAFAGIFQEIHLIILLLS